jgi:hypothetical protein
MEIASLPGMLFEMDGGGKLLDMGLEGPNTQLNRRVRHTASQRIVL